MARTALLTVLAAALALAACKPAPGSVRPDPGLPGRPTTPNPQKIA